MQAVADGKKTVADEDILALMGDEASQDGKLWDLLDLQVSMLLQVSRILNKLIAF